MAQGEAARFAHESERVVWERLRGTVADGTVLLANVRLTSQRKDHELDIVVLMPDVGIVVVEVKGGVCRWTRRVSGGPAAAPARAACAPSSSAATGSTRCASSSRPTLGGGTTAAGCGSATR
ncbi:hypothetical protein GCM10027039_03960 [Terrabacter koreensis]